MALTNVTHGTVTKSRGPFFVLLLNDLPAAFDTVDHSLLFKELPQFLILVIILLHLVSFLHVIFHVNEVNMGCVGAPSYKSSFALSDLQPCFQLFGPGTINEL